MTENRDKGVVTRFAPSPTGVLHVGSARTALFNFLYARKHSGKVILRIEDTDKERSKSEYEEDIKKGLSWLGMSFDEEYRQSERTDIYKELLEKLIADDKAYVSKEEPKEEGARTEVIRFRNPGTEVTFHDEVRGDITVDTTDLGDFVIAKDLETPLYNFVVVVDDHLMGVTHVIRGDDGIANTPRQILIQQALGAARPVYVHLPLILAPDRSKLSKRHGAVSVSEYEKMGYLPEAIVNFLALIGWNPGDDREIFSMDDLIHDFSLEHIHKGGAIFNQEKLDWVNREYIKKLSPEELLAKIVSVYGEKNSETLKKIVPLIVERINTFSDIQKLYNEKEFAYFFEAPAYTKELFFWKKENNPDKIHERLVHTGELLEKITTFDAESVKSSVWDYAEEEGRGAVLWPMRVALSGREKSVDPFTIASIIGKDETLKRLKNASEILS